MSGGTESSGAATSPAKGVIDYLGSPATSGVDPVLNAVAPDLGHDLEGLKPYARAAGMSAAGAGLSNLAGAAGAGAEGLAAGAGGGGEFAGGLMPAAVAESPAALAAQGMVQTGPGAWSAAEPFTAGAALGSSIPTGGAGGGGGPSGGEAGPDPLNTGSGVGSGAQGSATQAPGAGGVDAAAPAPAPVAPQPVTTTAPTATNLPVGTGGTSSAPGVDPLRLAVDNATGAAGPAAGGAQSSSGITKALESIGIMKNGTIGPNALPMAINLGSAALKSGSQNSLEGQLKKTAAPAQAASERLLSQGASGQIPPAIMQQFQQSFKDKSSEITQRYANMGRDAATDSAAQAEIARAKDALDAQVAKYSSDLTSQGLAAAGVAAGPASQAAMAGAQADKELQAAMAGSLQQMALLEALGRGRQAPAEQVPAQ